MGVNLDTNEKVAIKKVRKLSKDDMWTRRKGAQKDEVKLLMMLNHPKIIKLRDFFETRDAMYIVQELYVFTLLYLYHAFTITFTSRIYNIYPYMFYTLFSILFHMFFHV